MTTSTQKQISEEECREITRDFNKAVNMTPESLAKWLETDDSARVGQKEGDGESVGHQSGKRIVQILEKPAKDRDEADYAHMRKVVGYIHRHRAQGPTRHDVETSDWRYSLMNWGHDPLKD